MTRPLEFVQENNIVKIHFRNQIILHYNCNKQYFFLLFYNKE